jgi:hypothetical protein
VNQTKGKYCPDFPLTFFCHTGPARKRWGIPWICVFPKFWGTWRRSNSPFGEFLKFRSRSW